MTEHAGTARTNTGDGEIDELAARRPPVQIDGQQLSIGATAVEAYSRHVDDVLMAFIELIRLVRRGPSPIRMAFRHVDIEVLADDLSVSADTVLDHLAALVGADDDRLDVMTGQFESGATVIDSGLRDIELDPRDPSNA